MTPKNNVKRKRIVHEGRYLRLIHRDGWEYFERCNCTGIVIIVAKTRERKVILVEQFRLPVGKKVIEFPAGLVNDRQFKKKESLEKAALRELFEETGYRAKGVRRLLTGPVSAGACADLVTMVEAYGLRKVGRGGGDETENITVHEVPLQNVRPWLRQKEKEGYLVEPKVFTGLYFLKG